MDPSEVVNALQNIISNYAPSDHSSELFNKSQADALALFENELIAAEDKLTIASVLPHGLLSCQIIDILVAAAAPPADVLATLLKGICSVPPTQAGEIKEHKEWFSGFLRADAYDFSNEDRYVLSNLYLECYDKQDSLSQEEAKSIANQLQFCFQYAIQEYAAETHRFKPEKVQKILHLSATTLLQKTAETHTASDVKEVLALIRFLDSSALSGDLSTLQGFSTSWGIPQASMEALVRDMALYQYVHQSTTETIPFTKVKEMLTGNVEADEVSAFNSFHDYKVIRHLMFVDGLCKLDEVNHCIVLNDCAVNGSSMKPAKTILDTLTHWKSLLELALASGPTEQAES